MRRTCLLVFPIALVMLISCNKKINEEIPNLKAERISELMKLGAVTGLQVTYFDKENEYTFANGFKSTSDSSLIDENTIFEAASLSKQVTAVLALKLAEKGILNLDEPIAKSVDYQRLSADDNYAEINLKHLLSHTSGLPNWGGDTLYTDFKPGEGWQYSGEGYVIISKVIESVTGIGFEENCQKEIFQPLKMMNTSFVWNDAFGNNFAQGHSDIEVPKTIRQRKKPNAAASLLTTAADYAKFIQAAFFEDFLENPSKSLMLTEVAKIPTWDDTESKLGWAYGIGTDQSSDQILWQWGDNYRYKGLLLLNPVQQKGLVYLTNSQNGLSIAGSLASLFFENKLNMLDWMDYSSFEDSEHQITINLTKTFYWKDQAQALQYFGDIKAEVTESMFNNSVWSLFKEKKLDKAKWLIDGYLEEYPSSAEAWIRQGEALGFDHQYQASWQAYQKAMELDPNTGNMILPRFPWYMEAMNAIQKNDGNITKEDYIGKYGEIEITLKSSGLYYSDSSIQDIELVSLSKEVFDLDNLETFRLQFLFENETVVGLVKSHLTGEKETISKD